MKLKKQGRCNWNIKSCSRSLDSHTKVHGFSKKSNEEFIVICGGVIPKDFATLKEKGVSEIFGPGTNLLDAIYKIFNLIKYGKKSNV